MTRRAPESSGISAPHRHASITTKGPSGSSSLRRECWCAWGAALAATPYTLRSATSLVLAPRLYCLPMQYQIAPLCVLLVLLVAGPALTDSREESGSSSPMRLTWLAPVAVLSQTVIYLCEMGWMPMRMGQSLLIDYQECFELLSGLALVVSGAAWTWFGIQLVGSAEPSPNTDRGVRRFGVIALAFGALLPTLIQVLGSVSQGSPLDSLLLCALAGASAWRACRSIVGSQHGRREMILIASCLVGGLILGSALRDVTEELVLVWLSESTAPEEGTATLLKSLLPSWVAFASVLLAAGALVWHSARSKPSPGTSDDVESRILALPGAEGLSQRQREVLTLLVLGKDARGVAEELGIAVGTVGTHQSRGLRRLGAESMLDLSQKIDLNSPPSRHAANRRRYWGLVVVLALLPLLWAGGSPMGRCTLLFVCSALVLVSLARLTARRGTARTGRLSMTRVTPLACALCLGSLSGTYASTGVPPMSWAVSAALLVMLGLRRTTSLSSASKGTADRASGDLTPHFLALYGAGAILSSGIPLVHSPGLPQFIACVACLVMVSKPCLDLALRSHAARSTDPVDEKAEKFDYLVTRGLGETEARIALLTSRGYTRPQICSMLNVAPGTVNAARSSSYAKLGVHSARELAELLGKIPGQQL